MANQLWNQRYYMANFIFWKHLYNNYFQVEGIKTNELGVNSFLGYSDILLLRKMYNCGKIRLQLLIDVTFFYGNIFQIWNLQPLFARMKVSCANMRSGNVSTINSTLQNVPKLVESAVAKSLHLLPLVDLQLLLHPLHLLLQPLVRTRSTLENVLRCRDIVMIHL